MPKLKPNQFILSGHLITELPILYQTEMVRAICADRKTQTRRTNGFTNENLDKWSLCFVGDTLVNQKHPKVFGALFQQKQYPEKVAFIKLPFGQPGDLLWVRETWKISEFPEHDGPFEYKASMGNPDASWNKGIWKPSIHMPKEACRIWLMVEEIRVERLQDISQADAIAEGIEKHPDWQIFKRYDWPLKKPMSTSNPYVSFMTLWKSINGEESWNENPWVWVIKFRVLSKTGRPSDEVILSNYLDVIRKEVENA